MSCCNLCFQVNLYLADPGQVQAHTFCSVPTKEELVAYICGQRPEFIGNTWVAQKALRYCLSAAGEQVWMVNGDEFYTVDGTTCTRVEPPV